MKNFNHAYPVCERHNALTQRDIMLALASRPLGARAVCGDWTVPVFDNSFRCPNCWAKGNAPRDKTIPCGVCGDLY